MANYQGTFFEYSLTRPYPFKHFTCIAVVFVIVWLSIATTITILSQGYTVVTTLSTNWPEYNASGNGLAGLLSGAQSSCQPRLFDTGDAFRTNNSGLLYSLAEFDSPSNTPADFAGYPGLVYSNDLFQGCTVESIQIQAYSSNSFVPIAYPKISCQGPQNISLTTTYTSSSGSSQIGVSARNSFLKADLQTHASMYWASVLLDYYYTSLENILPIVNQQNFSNVVLSSIIIDATFRNVSDMGASEGDLELSLVAKGVSPNSGSAEYAVPAWDPLHSSGPPSQTVIGIANLGTLLSGTSNTSADYFAAVWPDITDFLVSLYWAVLADLGQQIPNNIFVNETALTTLSEPFPGRSFADLGSGKQLGIKPAAIVATYLCQRAQLKPTFSLITGVLVADTVMLSVGWAILTMIATRMARKRYYDANTCPCTNCVLSVGQIYFPMPPVNPDLKFLERRVSSRQAGVGLTNQNRRKL